MTITPEDLQPFNPEKRLEQNQEYLLRDLILFPTPLTTIEDSDLKSRLLTLKANKNLLKSELGLETDEDVDEVIQYIDSLEKENLTLKTILRKAGEYKDTFLQQIGGSLKNASIADLASFLFAERANIQAESLDQKEKDQNLQALDVFARRIQGEVGNQLKIEQTALDTKLVVWQAFLQYDGDNFSFIFDSLGIGESFRTDTKAIFDSMYLLHSTIDSLQDQNSNTSLNSIQSDILLVSQEIHNTNVPEHIKQIIFFVFHRIESEFYSIDTVTNSLIPRSLENVFAPDRSAINEKIISPLSLIAIRMSSLESREDMTDTDKSELRNFILQTDREFKLSLLTHLKSKESERNYLTKYREKLIVRAILLLGESLDETRLSKMEVSPFFGEWMQAENSRNTIWTSSQKLRELYKLGGLSALSEQDKKEVLFIFAQFSTLYEQIIDVSLSGDIDTIFLPDQAEQIFIQMEYLRVIVTDITQENEQLAQERAAAVAAAAKEKEPVIQNSWHKFQKIYLIKHGYPEELIGKETPKAHREQAKAFMKWTIHFRNILRDGDNPYVAVNIMDKSLAEIESDLTLKKLVENVQAPDVIKWIFGFLKTLDKGKGMYDTQLNPGEQYKLFEDYQINALSMLFGIETSPSGNLAASKYLQFGLIAIMHHDTNGRHRQYKKAHSDYFGSEHIDAFDSEPMYGPQGNSLRDILYSEQAGVGPEAYKDLVGKLAQFILTQDARHGDGTLLEEDAKFFAESAIGAAEFFGIIDTTDTTHTAKRIKARFAFLATYRFLKGNLKEVGSPQTFSFFMTLLMPFLAQNIVNGVSLEQLVALTGVTSEDRADFYGLPAEITKLEEAGIFNLFDQTIGENYRRLSDFVLKIYSILIGKESTGLFEGDGTKLRSLHNDIVSYYYGDIVHNLDEQDRIKPGESEQAFFERIKALRDRYAVNGYLLVKSTYPAKGRIIGEYKKAAQYKKGPEDEYTTNLDEAEYKDGYVFSPAFDWFDLIDKAKLGLSHDDDLIMHANQNYQNWKQLHSVADAEFGSSDLAGQTKLAIVRWLCIDEMAKKQTEFEEKELPEKIKQIEQIYKALNQGAFNTNYTLSFKGLRKTPRFAPFGLMSFDQVTDMLLEAGWIQPKPGYAASLTDPHLDAIWKAIDRLKLAARNSTHIRPQF